MPFCRNLYQMAMMFYQHPNFQLRKLMEMLERSSKDQVGETMCNWIATACEYCIDLHQDIRYYTHGSLLSSFGHLQMNSGNIGVYEFEVSRVDDESGILNGEVG